MRESINSLTDENFVKLAKYIDPQGLVTVQPVETVSKYLIITAPSSTIVSGKEITDFLSCF